MDINKVMDALQAHNTMQNQLEELIRKDAKKAELAKQEKEREDHKQKSNFLNKITDTYNELSSSHIDKRSVKKE